MDYLVIVEGHDANFSAYVPDLPGCVTVGETVDEVRENIKEAISLFLEESTRCGIAVPPATTKAITVAAA